MKTSTLRYQIALSLIPGIGDVNAKKLLAHCGSPEAVFKQSKQQLQKIPGIGEQLASAVGNKDLLEQAEKEATIIQEEGIKTYFYLDQDYPFRLKQCDDAPILLYQLGKADLNRPKMISIVGTRNATSRGRDWTEKLIRELATQYPDLIVVSGLAYGIDIMAHRTALECGLETIAVLAHGLHTIYPALHRSDAATICQQGALLTDFTSNVLPERNNFIKRNRIIAGMTDATIVVESAVQGGALITGDLAASYHRDVFAFPGRAEDTFSAGCNQLIKQNKAALIESAADLLYFMGWQEQKHKNDALQMNLFRNLSEEEQSVLRLIREEGEISVDLLARRLKMPVQNLTPLLLQLEFAGLIKAAPGNIYKR